ncbi:MAG: adenylate cyclase [Flavobacterium sp. BFFFF2]|nr:MAG: adenylate cyclase [Flavobacterium sp. BFFFF2]
MLEIERKFLVNDLSALSKASSQQLLVQAYLCTDPARTVRIRIAKNEAFITIKGASQTDGISRFEWEKSIEISEAEQLMLLAELPPIRKQRYVIPWGELKVELDVFEGANAGLVIAEIELPSADFPLKIPSWLGKEVSDDPRYYNSYLIEHPFVHW